MQASTKNEVESVIMRQNSGSFRLACSSPLLEGNVCSQLGISVEGVLVYEILSNKENLEESPEVKKNLGLLKTDKREKIDTAITTEKCTERWNKSKERTSSSYSGFHFGHHKAHTLIEELYEIKCRVTNLSIKNGQPLKRWLCGVSVMLEKSPGSIDVKNLRAILFLEGILMVFTKQSSMVH